MVHFDWIQRHAERTPKKLALVDDATGRRFTYAEFNERANRLASFLQEQLGLEKGDRLSILAQNSSDYFEVLFACSKSGVILNTLNWRLARPELAYILSDCRPRALIYEAEFAETVAGLRSQIEAEHYIVIDEQAAGSDWLSEEAAHLVVGATVLYGLGQTRVNR